MATGSGMGALRGRRGRSSLVASRALAVLVACGALRWAACRAGALLLLGGARWQPPGRALTSRGRVALAAETKAADGAKAGKLTDGELKEAMNALEDFEEMGDSTANTIATDEEVAEKIAREATASEDAVEKQALSEAAAKAERERLAKVLPSSDVYDVESLIAKYGGVDEVEAAHKVAVRENLWSRQALKELKQDVLDEVTYHLETGREQWVELKHKNGAKLTLVGTLHISHDCRDWVRDIVRREKPECLVMERSLGDDGLEELTIPKDLHCKLAMANSPVQLKESDDLLERAWKFQEDQAWLFGTVGWNDIGGSAAYNKEMLAAFTEFAEQREKGEAGGPRGGTAVFADFDYRLLDESFEKVPPNMEDMARIHGCLGLRDLRFARACRAAVNTHKSAVCVVGKDHLGGIVKLLKQDKKMKVVKSGNYRKKSPWERDLEENDGRAFEREVLSGRSPLFMRMASEEVIDEAPVGSWMSADGVLEMLGMKRKTEALMKEAGENVDRMQPVTPGSGVIANDFLDRNIMATPGGISDLKKWLNGERIENRLSDKKVFPFENRRLSKPASQYWSNTFQEKPKKRDEPKFYRRTGLG